MYIFFVLFLFPRQNERDLSIELVWVSRYDKGRGTASDVVRSLSRGG